MTTSRHVLALLATATLGVLAVGSSAWAGEGDELFQQMDANKDGRVSSQEHESGAAAMFARMDANKDNQLTGGELMQMHRAMRAAHGMQGPGRNMAMMDADHDGEITAAEHAAGAAAMFARMDTNKDGRLKDDELQHGRNGEHHAGRHAGMADKHADGHKTMGKDHASMPAMQHEGMKRDAMKSEGMKHDAMKHEGMKHGAMKHEGMKHEATAKARSGHGGGNHHAGMASMMDADHDGKLTASEHANGAASMFAKVDADQDGFVTRAEFDAGMKAMRTP